MIAKYSSLSEWSAAVAGQGLVLVRQESIFKAFDKKANCLGYWLWLAETEYPGVLSDTIGEIEMPVKTVKLKVTSPKDIERCWIMPVASSNINSLAYDYVEEQLYVKFHSGDTYRYSGVPLEYWLGITKAESVGSYLQASKKLLDTRVEKVLWKKKE